MNGVLTFEAPSEATLCRSSRTDGTDPTLVGLLVLFAGLLFLVPGRYTVPFGAGVGLRPYQIVVLVAAVVLSRRFVRGTRLSLGLPAWIAGLLVLTAVISIVANQDLDNETFLDSFRLTATTIFHVLIAVAVGVLATTPRRRRRHRRRGRDDGGRRFTVRHP